MPLVPSKKRHAAVSESALQSFGLSDEKLKKEERKKKKKKNGGELHQASNVTATSGNCESDGGFKNGIGENREKSGEEL